MRLRKPTSSFLFIKVNYVHFNFSLHCKSFPWVKIHYQEVLLLVYKSLVPHRKSPLDWFIIVPKWRPMALNILHWISPISICVIVRIEDWRATKIHLLFFHLALDYEWWTENNNPNPFRFIVECTILSNQVKQNIDFQLDLLDVNDNPPIFYQNFSRINLTEDTPVNSTIQVNISAYDGDSGLGGMINYYLPNSSNYSVSENGENWFLFWRFLVVFSSEKC